MNHLVIHKHIRGGNTHWDLMLELPGQDKLATWRIDTCPQDWHIGPIAAEKIFDHDKKFLTYQGPVNDGQGTVEIIDIGELKILSENDDRIEFILTGKILTGTFVLSNNKLCQSP